MDGTGFTFLPHKQIVWERENENEHNVNKRPTI